MNPIGCMQLAYVATSREIKRMEAAAHAPMLSHLSEILQVRAWFADSQQELGLKLCRAAKP